MRYLLAICLLLLVPAGFCCAAQPAAQEQQVVIDQQEMAQVLNDYLTDVSRQLPHVRLQLKQVRLPDSFSVPQGRIEYEIIPSDPDVIGSRRMTLLTRVDGSVVSNLSMRVELEALAEVVVAAEPLRRGVIVQQDDVKLSYLDISRIEEPFFSLKDVVGQQLKRSLRLGTPIEQPQVEYPPVVKKGEKVIIVAQARGLQLTAAGEARQDGRGGEMIRVRNSSTRKEVLCRVVAPGQVTVEF